MKTLILLSNGYLPVSKPATVAGNTPQAQAALGTFIANLAALGFAPNLAAIERLKTLSVEEIGKAWKEIKPALNELTGANRKMENFVVYKNFPREVLEMSQAQYWISQILMYLGAPNDWFTESVEERKPLDERLKLKVLQLAPLAAFDLIYSELMKAKASWTVSQKEHAIFLAADLNKKKFDLSDFGFKDNGICLIAAMINTAKEGTTVVRDATDVLRLAAALSGAASLRDAFKFRAFKRSERRFLLNVLENTKNLEEDMAARPELFKKLLMRLHPGEFKMKRVASAYDKLYNGELETFNAKIENLLNVGDVELLKLLEQRPGDLVRRFSKLYEIFGVGAIASFESVVDKLTTLQLLRLSGYLNTLSSRKNRQFAPKGNWAKMQVATNTKQVEADDLKLINSAIGEVLTARLKKEFPKGVYLDKATEMVKLQSNGQELAPYGRGTVFPIPENVTFVRSASYWEHAGHYGNTWFDNGWNFFNADWKNVSACCWNTTTTKGALFSGDPTNSKDLKGRGCQMIDLYLDKLIASGVRYAVWNVLCYSGVPFSDAPEVLATLQWGEKEQSGKLYEPARAQMVFPLTGKALTKYVAYIDLVERKLVYLDANLPGRVNSAALNSAQLQTSMPALIEHLNSLPSVADLFKHAPKKKTVGATKVLYTDDGVKIKGGKAYVFKPQNADNKFDKLDLAPLLGV